LSSATASCIWIEPPPRFAYASAVLTGKPWQLEPALQFLLRLFGCFGAGMVALAGLRAAVGETAAGSLPALALGIGSTHGGVLLLTVFFLRAHAVTWTEAFGLRRQVGWALALGGAVFVIILPVTWALQSLLAGWFQRHGFEFEQQEAVRLLRETSGFWRRGLLALFAVVIAPVAEEIFFRGLLYPLVKQHTARGFAVVTVSLGFALLHGNVPVLLPLWLLAVVLTLLYEWTGNLLACVTVHALFNAANFAALFLVEKFGDRPPL
jgi:membrane protease YdiL (CAAX protease family)